MPADSLPRVERSLSKTRAWVREQRKRGRTVGFVPTMGQLHDGHLSLMRAAKRRCDVVVVSIFVNPTQFGAGEDYERYPRNLKRDRRACGEVGVDLIFAPTARAMYPAEPMLSVQIPGLMTMLDGDSRPGHFDGVCLVVSKLLNIVLPDELYLGRKDYQQSVILRRMVAELDFPVKVRVVPTVRERGGLAMSSRNLYLSSEDRREALRLVRSLRAAKKAIASGETRAAEIRKIMRKELRSPRVEVDYVAVVDPDTLRSLSVVEGPVMLMVAAVVGPARLIDNMPARPPRRKKGTRQP